MKHHRLRPGPHRARRALLSLAAIAFLITKLTAAPTPLGLASGETIVLAGTTRVLQTRTNEGRSETLADLRFDASLLLHAPGRAAASEPAERRFAELVIARGLTPRGQTEAARGLIERSLDPRSLYESPQELDELVQHFAIHFPLVLDPRVEGGSDAKKFLALGQIEVEGDFVFESGSEAAGPRFERRLRSGSSAGFDFNRQRAEIAEHSEAQRFNASGRPTGYRSKSRAILPGGIEVTIEVELESKRAGVLEGVDAYYVSQSHEGYDALSEELRARPASASLTERIEKLAKLTLDTPFLALGQAIRSRLAAYHTTFEEGPEAALLSRLLGRSPPDFELEDLAGKKVKLSEAIRGRVAYLNFWGVG